MLRVPYHIIKININGFHTHHQNHNHHHASCMMHTWQFIYQTIVGHRKQSSIFHTNLANFEIIRMPFEKKIGSEKSYRVILEKGKKTKQNIKWNHGQEPLASNFECYLWNYLNYCKLPYNCHRLRYTADDELCWNDFGPLSGWSSSSSYRQNM